MFFRKSTRIQNSIDTLIGDGTRIEGNVVFAGGLRVDGFIHGNVSELTATPSTLILSEHGSVEGDVTVSKVVINGKVMGPVKADQFIELQAKAYVTGDIYYRSLEMHTGATVDGKLVHLGDNIQSTDIRSD